MKTIDIVKPAPVTELEIHKRWLNRLSGEAVIAYGRKVEVKS
jgi:hypothetical protein